MNELTVEELVDKAINEENLTEKQWQQVIEYAKDNEIAEVEGDISRWTRLCIIVFPYKNKIYGVSYDEGLTECQDNDYAGCSIGEVHKVIRTYEDWEYV
ncbi:hypothetical protein [Phascolarctobacterium succinatutens]|uniref:hypothetical protein n=1 Tax=Phascolarctobacterium succinatutens TaxID=626940 RepID=UPI00307E0B8A